MIIQEHKTLNFIELNKILDNGTREELEMFCEKNHLEIRGSKIYAKEQESAEYWYEYWDKNQHVKKILLNSLYGGLLNEGNLFYDKRLGQSTTLSGRTISRHQTAKVNEIITGDYDIYGASQIYGDTDSVLFSAYPVLKEEIENGTIEWTKESVVELYDSFEHIVNDSYPEFLNKKLNVPKERSAGVIKSSREIVAESGIFITKKRYAALYYDKEGVRLDSNGRPGKMKVTGLDLRRADTPKFVQDFLLEILTGVLLGKTEEDTIEKIKTFKEKYNSMKPWQRGTPKGVKGLTKYMNLKEEVLEAKMKGVKMKMSIPGHVQASMNWNRMLDSIGDRKTQKIVDGSKVIVCPLLEGNIYGMKSIAYPVDCPRLPEWFMELPFDDEKMEETVLDGKIENMLGVLKWDFSRASRQHDSMSDLFEF